MASGGGRLAVLDRPRRHLHRHRGARPDGPALHRQAAVARTRAATATPPSPASAPASACAPDAADPARHDRGGEDGHHRRHQRAAGAQGRAGAAAGQPRLRRPAAHRQPGPAAPVRPRMSGCPTCCTSASPRSAAASPWTARRSSRWTRTPPAPRWRDGARRRHPRRRHRADARLGASGARAAPRRAGARGGLHPGLAVATRRRRCRASCRAATPPWWTPTSRRSCAATSSRCARRTAGGVRLYFMQSTGGLAEAGRFQGKDAILSGPAGGIVGAARTAAMAGLRPHHRLRHGRHLDRRRALRRRVRARLRDAGGRRAHARADDGDQHGRGRRRLDPALRRRALPRRAGQRRRRCRARPATAAAGR